MFKRIQMVGFFILAMVAVYNCDNQGEDSSDLSSVEIVLSTSDLEPFSLVKSGAIAQGGKIMVVGSSLENDNFNEMKLIKTKDCTPKAKKKKNQLVERNVCKTDATVLGFVVCSETSEKCQAPKIDHIYDLSKKDRPDITILITHCLKDKPVQTWMALSSSPTQDNAKADNIKAALLGMGQVDTAFSQKMGKAATDVAGEITFRMLGKEEGDVFEVHASNIHLSNISAPSDGESAKDSITLSFDISRSLSPPPEACTDKQAESSALDKTNGASKSGNNTKPQSASKRRIKFQSRKAKPNSADKIEIEKAITRALADWQQILKQSAFSLKAIGGSRRRLAAHFDYSETCDAGTDLKFLFGVYNQQVRTLIKQKGYPIAFSQMTDYDPVQGSGKGVIWLMPDRGTNIYQGMAIIPFWQHGAVYPVLMHELGHVWGIGHDFGSFMAAEVPNKIVTNYLHYVRQPGDAIANQVPKPLNLKLFSSISSTSFSNASAPIIHENYQHPTVCTRFAINDQSDQLAVLNLSANNLFAYQDIFHLIFNWQFPPDYEGIFQLCLKTQLQTIFPSPTYQTILAVRSLDKAYQGIIPVQLFAPPVSEGEYAIQGFYHLHNFRQFLTRQIFLTFPAHNHRGKITVKNQEIEFKLA